MHVLRLKLTGRTELLMHRDTLANPTSEEAKAHKTLTAKRTKTEEDHIAIARSEFNSSLYTNEEGKLALPTVNILSSFVDGAKLSKQGTKVQRGVVTWDKFVPLEYDGPEDLDELFDRVEFKDVRSVVVNKSRLIRYRPKFLPWSCVVDLECDDRVIDVDIVIQSAEDAGRFCGIGDFRPNKGGPFGRYTVEKVATK